MNLHISDIVSKLQSGAGYAASAIVSVLEDAAAVAPKLTEVAAFVGGGTIVKAINVVGAIAEAAVDLKSAADNANVVFSTDQLDRIDAIIASLAVENDNLAKLVDAS